jgi:pimeloyl-ACP methyl ester carboxylesterase
MPTAQITIYPNIGHLPQEEAPAATLGDLLPWLAEHVPTPNLR